jgi:hypothetical protein
MKDTKILYERALPGGGYVHVEEDDGKTSIHRGRIAVERRLDPVRRDGHEPPIIAVAEGATAQSVIRQLLEIATDNVAIAHALLRRQAGGRARF